MSYTDEQWGLTNVCSSDLDFLAEFVRGSSLQTYSGDSRERKEGTAHFWKIPGVVLCCVVLCGVSSVPIQVWLSATVLV